MNARSLLEGLAASGAKLDPVSQVVARLVLETLEHHGRLHERSVLALERIAAALEDRAS